MGLSTMTMPKAAAWLRRLSSGLVLYRGATNLAVMRSTPCLTQMAADRLLPLVLETSR